MGLIRTEAWKDFMFLVSVTNISLLVTETKSCDYNLFLFLRPRIGVKSNWIEKLQLAAIHIGHFDLELTVPL